MRRELGLLIAVPQLQSRACHMEAHDENVLVERDKTETLARKKC